MSGEKAVHALGVVAVVTVLMVGMAMPVTAICTLVEGELLVPTGNRNPPPVVVPAMETLGLVKIVDEAQTGKSYTLISLAAVLTSCVGSNCAHVPDFNIAWYDAAGTIILDDDTPGDQSGTVPGSAARGVVYMPFGPDAGQTDGSLKARFRLQQDCPA